VAITQGTETVALTTEERTWKVEIFCDKGADPIVRVHRQLVKYDPSGAIVGIENNATVERHQSQVAANTFTVAGITVTGNQLAALISQAADQWRTEDLNNQTPVTAEEPPAPEPEPETEGEQQ
jgi:hypothetical protein